MTRTFVAGGGEPPEELARVLAAHPRVARRASTPTSAPGANGRELFERSCEPYIEAGQPTQLTKEPGKVLEDGYFHGLGHGVGLEVHERPVHGPAGRRPASPATSSRSSRAATGAGSAAAGWRTSCVVTEDGYEVLTDFPYDL